MSWSDPKPPSEAQNGPRPAFRAGLTLVGSTDQGGAASEISRDRSGQGVVTALPFGTTSGSTGGHVGGFGQGPGSGLGLGTRLGRLLAQRFEQFGEQPAEPGEVTAPDGRVRPVMFSPFGGEEGDVPEIEAASAADELELVESGEPAPPPIDYEALKAEAWSEGFRQGYDEGKRLATQEQQDTTIRLGALLHDIVADTEGFIRGLEADMVELVLGVAEKVIGREATVDPKLVVHVVRSALNEVHDATEVRIRAHPDDVAILEPRWQEMLPRRVAERSELLADELVERGGVVVETQIGYVDSQLKTRLQQVVNTFHAVLDGEPV
jgi:flagellar assembly protein FliH